MRKTVLTIVGLLMLVVGLVWFFQGIGVILGSFMTGTTQWTIIGAILVLLSLPVLRSAWKK